MATETGKSVNLVLVPAQLLWGPYAVSTHVGYKTTRRVLKRLVLLFEDQLKLKAQPLYQLLLGEQTDPTGKAQIPLNGIIDLKAPTS